LSACRPQSGHLPSAVSKLGLDAIRRLFLIWRSSDDGQLVWICGALRPPGLTACRKGGDRSNSRRSRLQASVTLRLLVSSDSLRIEAKGPCLEIPPICRNSGTRSCQDKTWHRRSAAFHLAKQGSPNPHSSLSRN